MKLKERQAHYYNRSARDLEPLKIQDPVRIAPPDGIGLSKEQKKGVVTMFYPIAFMKFSLTANITVGTDVI